MARTQDVLDHPVTRAVSGTALVGGIVAAVVISLSALISPLPSTDLREPVIVDDRPELPTDEEPASGFPVNVPGDAEPAVMPDTDDPTDAAATDGTRPATASGDGGGEPTDGESLLDKDADAPLDDTIDDVTGDVADTVDNTVGDVTDAVDGTLKDLTDPLDDTVGDTDDTTGALDDVVGETNDGLGNTTGNLLP